MNLLYISLFINESLFYNPLLFLLGYEDADHKKSMSLIEEHALMTRFISYRLCFAFFFYTYRI